MSTNEQIALELGWLKKEGERISDYFWVSPHGATSRCCPDFEHSWAHAGPLQAELVHESPEVTIDSTPEWTRICVYHAHPSSTRTRQVTVITAKEEINEDARLTKATCAAWLAWKKEEKDD